MTSSIQDLLDWLRDGQFVGYEDARLLIETLETIEDQMRAANEGLAQPDLTPLRDIAEIGDGAVKKLATIALARFGDSESLSYISTLINDSLLPVRQAAVYSVGSLQQRESLRALVKILEDRSENIELRSAAAMSLGNLQYSEAIPALIRTLRDSEVCMRRLAANALGLIGAVPGEDSPVGPLQALLTDEVPEVRGAATEALGRIGVSTAADSLLEAANDEHPAVRRKAAFALANLHDSRALPLLVDMLDDRNSASRHVAANALGEFADPQSIRALSTAVRDEDVQVRLAAVQSLHRIGDRQALNILRDVRNTETDPSVTQALNDAISELESEPKTQEEPPPAPMKQMQKAHQPEEQQTPFEEEAQQVQTVQEEQQPPEEEPEPVVELKEKPAPEPERSVEVDVHAAIDALSSTLQCESEPLMDGVKLFVPLPAGGSQEVRVTVGEDDDGERVVRISSVCGPADSGNYRNALLVNNYLTYGSITIEEARRYEDFVLRETLPAENVTHAGLAAIVRYIASTANQIARQLAGE